MKRDSAPSIAPPLNLLRVGALKSLRDPKEHWLIEDLWARGGVGVLGGPPKTCKTFLAVELALSVATGTKALGCFAVHEPGAVIFFAAEDAPALLRERFSALAAHRGVPLGSLDVFVPDVPILHLDDGRDQFRLEEAIVVAKPKLLILDPLVRLHSLDENSASEISGLLAFLRRVQRDNEVAILLVHHTRKNVSAGTQPGQGLRGSSDLHAWGDSNLYLRRGGDDLILTGEHRSARAPEPIRLRLVAEPAPHLEVVAREPGEESPEDSFAEEVFWCLKQATGAQRLEDLRKQLGVRKQRLVDALRELTHEGRVLQGADGFQCAPGAPED